MLHLLSATAKFLLVWHCIFTRAVMIAVKRNSSEFKEVKRILEEYRDKPSRKRMVLLYALKPTEPLSEKILINRIRENGEVLYDISYRSLLGLLGDKRFRLYRENRAGIYYFKTSASDNWLQLPFGFTGKLKKELFPLRVLK